jgi:hypothetical protein
VQARRNANREKPFAEEQAVLRELPPRRLESSRRLTRIPVSKGSTIQVQQNTYSVHSRLMGEEVDVVIGMEHVEVWYAGQAVQCMPRLCGSGKHAINYRHIIDSLVRKPGAFANYVYQEDLFPTSHFRMAYDALCRQHAGKRAVREYLKILQLAAKQSEAAVQDALRVALSQGAAISSAVIEAAVQSSQQVPAVTEVQVAAPDLQAFDSLLDHSCMEVECDEFSVKSETGIAVVSGETWCEVGCAADGTVAQRDVESLAVIVAADIGDERGTEGATSGTPLADVPRALPESGGTSRAGVAELPTLLGGTDASGMPGTPAEPDPETAGAIAAAACQDLGQLRLEADSAAGGPSGGEPPRRVVPGSPGEPAGLRQAGLGEDALPVCLGRTLGASGAFDPLCHMQPLGAEPLGGQTGLAIAEDDQATVAV